MMNKYALMFVIGLGFWLLPAATSLAEGPRVHATAGRGFSPFYFRAYQRHYSFYSPSWYYFHRPRFYYGNHEFRGRGR
jgi:hypothetical protein